ncbi:microtubule-associated serine/threonine-protein kinase 3-like [Dendrobates tinctorius]|uniref:microtubule-associated serine/threonine-protein kinase 3-like n=1 Tax=Dendrobates tinctorius TaxID=92724 RepID=UPI003CCA03C9
MIPNTNTCRQSAKNISREFLDREECGTPYYNAPEVILKKADGRPVDWWSMGIILNEFFLGFGPFDGASLSEFYGNVVTGDMIWDRHYSPPPDARVLITQLLITNPVDRLATAGGGLTIHILVDTSEPCDGPNH